MRVPWNSSSRLRELLCHGKSQDVLLHYRELNKTGVELTDHSVFPILLKACLNLSSTHGGNSIHASLVKHGFLAFTSVGNSMMDFYAKSGDLGSALVVFNCMGNKDSVSWNVIIHGHLLERAAAAAAAPRGLWFFTQAWAAGFEPNISTFVLVIQACRNLTAFHAGRTIHASTLRAGYSSITSVQNSLLSFYAEFGMHLAHNLFDEMTDRDVISWSVMVAGYAQSEEETVLALELFQRMIDFGITPDGKSVVSILKACSKLKAIRMGKSIHGFVISRGLGYDLFVHNSLIDLYSKCNDIDSSLRVFRGIPEKNVVSWNSLLSGLVQNEMHSEALTSFDLMQKAGVESDEVTLVNLLQLCKSFLEPYQCKLIHSRILRRGFELNELVTNSLIDAYASCNLITYAWSQFSNMRTRDAVTWSTMIAGFTHCGMPDEAIAVFREMSHISEWPNAITMLNLLEACALSADMKRSRWAHGIAIRRGLASDVVVGTAILDMYSKCGSIGSSRKVFDRIPQKNVVTWSAIIAAYGLIGLPNEALALLAEMKICGLRPNQVTALSLLSACSHGGLVEEGLSLFEELIWDHEVEPGLEHYSCLVDLLARAGKVDSAMNLIGKLHVGLKPGASAWGALLSACRNYENYEFGAIAFPQVVELEPSSSAGYLLASNMYASGHSWVDATKMRMLAKEGGVKVIAGYSLVYVNGKACRFLAGDNHHSLSDELQFAIQQLHSSMKMGITCG
ncbi:pentatricopeptide repeat-containing protein At2g17210 [Solanum dulcamara]|uniref:pentatricopeptide repeat-containing protein At2g17210 n=1 Tax=Solanum dulcamara TaxID=45834 RepID=UPI002486C5E0|nr:pentatricopeptide repeat-containing protein At2g17210 [Solanum dulcamara]